MRILTKLRDEIQSLSKFHQLEVLKILQKENVEFTENRNGVFINMNELKKKTITLLNKYLTYVSKQQLQIDIIEKRKEGLKLSFFNNNNNNKESSCL